jgi:hypothetical protein
MNDGIGLATNHRAATNTVALPASTAYPTHRRPERVIDGATPTATATQALAYAMNVRNCTVGSSRARRADLAAGRR